MPQHGRVGEHGPTVFSRVSWFCLQKGTRSDRVREHDRVLFGSQNGFSRREHGPVELGNSTVFSSGAIFGIFSLRDFLRNLMVWDVCLCYSKHVLEDP